MGITSIARQCAEAFAQMKSGAGVLIISTGQAICSLILLGIFQAYKVHFFTASTSDTPEGTSPAARVLSFKSPLDFVFYLAAINNTFAVFGFAGVLYGQKELVTAFFSWNSVQMVIAWYFFIDVVVDVKIKFAGEPQGLTPYENAAAAFLFFNFVLSIAATIFALRAIDEIKVKQKEEYKRLSVLSDTLQFEVES